MKVNELIFLANFYILHMEDSASLNSSPILLGRPFLKTTRAKIDVHNGTLSMEFDDEIVRFNIFDAMKHPRDDQSVCSLDIEETLDTYSLEVVLSQALPESNLGTRLDDELQETIIDSQSLPMTFGRHDLCKVELPISLTRLLPSIEQAPDLELKPLPDHLKYVYLGDNQTLPVIIAKELTSIQEEKLTNVLRNHKTAIGWTIADIKGISPSTCMHRILLEDNAKPNRDAQR